MIVPMPDPSADETRPDQSAAAVLGRPPYRWMPLVWQVPGVVLTVGGYLAGTLTVVEVASHIAALSFFTAVYLSVVVRDRRYPQDFLAVLGYLMYATFLAFVSAPSLWELGPLAMPTRAVGLACGGLLLPLTWVLFAEYLVHSGSSDSE